MKVIKASDVLKVGTISNGNNAPWNSLIDYINENNITEDVQFDFEEIFVQPPHNSESFKKFIQIPNVHMKIYNNKKTEDTISLMCAFAGLGTNKIENEMPVEVEKKTKLQVRIDTLAESMLKYFVINKNAVYIEIYKQFQQIGNMNTSFALEAAIRQHAAKYNKVFYICELQDLFIQESVIDNFSNAVKNLKKDNINLSFRSNSKELQGKIEMSIKSKDNKIYTKAERSDIIKSRLIPGHAGLLTKYKEGKAVDIYGRIGKGAKLSVRIALFKGFETTKDKILAVFNVYDTSRFYTKAHWYLEHDTEELKELKYDVEKIDINDLGIYNDVLGPRYHFSSPIQYAPGGEVTMFKGVEINGHQSVVGTKLTIPERIQAVFDDFEVDYNREYIENCIKNTRITLANKM
ncbi:MAG: hypothetical protein IJ593_04740 [Lachnospiraceae bacterium]|nr:hypothetical protein [Lachnospiraceae bacterium]